MLKICLSMKIPYDKKLHVIASMCMLLFFALFFTMLEATYLSLLVGICKEVIWDKWLGKGTPDIYDMVANVAGITLGSFIVFLIEYLMI